MKHVCLMPSLNTSILKEIPVSYPSLSEQKSIAAILTSFDDKIELLQAQNKTLEELAQTIFKEWFAKYKVGDKLPDGWGVGKLSEFGKIICGKTPSKSNEDYFGNDIPFIKIPDNTASGILDASGAKNKTISKRVIECVTPDNFVVAPLFIFITVRIVAPAPGIAPKNEQTIFPRP